jgi:hypothetical protein
MWSGRERTEGNLALNLALNLAFNVAFTTAPTAAVIAGNARNGQHRRRLRPEHGPAVQGNTRRPRDDRDLR